MTRNVKQAHRFAASYARACALLTLGALALAGLLGSAGCSSACQGDDCKPSCDEAECNRDGLSCVQNECRSSCERDSDCPDPQVCRSYQFSSGVVGEYCVVLPGSGGGGPGTTPGRFTSCKDSSQCDEAHGFACVSGECSYACSSHADCVEVGHCEAQTVDGQRQQFCVRDAAPPEPGKLYTSCPFGDECADPTLCLGAGPGDLDAYCSVDCSTDDDCSLGYYCGTVARSPCEDACGFRGVPSDPRCVSSDQIGADKPFQCSEQGVVRSVCRQREFCAPCESDADCLGTPNQICARDASGEKICTRLCSSGARSCPWGSAAECGVFDDELGQATCSHRFGSCHGQGQVCEPCRTHADCPGGICWSSAFTGEHWCIDLTARCDCQGKVESSGLCSNAGCPPSPSGLPLQCVGEPTSGLFEICYAANSGSGTLLGASPQTGCWDSN